MYSPSDSAYNGGDTFVHASTDHIHGPPRKKMRKGTKSCLECRRRKIKCTFEPHRPAVCNECFARGSTCIDQEHGDIQPTSTPSSAEQSYSLRERVTQLEGLVREVLNRLPENSARGVSTPSGPPVQGETQAAAEALENLKTSITAPAIESALSLPNGGHEDAPVLSLFDNAVFSRKDDPPVVSAHQHNKSKAILRELLSLLPPAKDLDIILEASSNWFNAWREIMPMISDKRCETYKEAVSHSLRSDSPAEVAKVILCIAISLDQMPAAFEETKLNLSAPARDLMEHYVNKVNELITSDDEIGATLDGIECMVLEAKFHINLGRPRRAWILFRRAIGFGQLLGLHRLNNHPIHDDPFLLRQQALWMHLFQGDRYISLILGLPYAVPERFCAIHIPSDTSKLRPGELFLIRVSPLLGKMIDRNQDPAHMSFSDTLRLDAELQEIAHEMPADWWSSDREQGTSNASENFYDKLIAQFFHHQIRSLIHLPFMLKSSSDKRYQYSHQAALDSARQMIRHFSVLREDELVGPFVCKLIDFQAFTAAMLILLNILGYKQSTRPRAGRTADEVAAKESNDQDARDWELIDETIACLRRCSQEPGGIVAAQSVKALEMMANVRHCSGHVKKSKDQTCRISIPYFGTIRIGAGDSFQMPPPEPSKPAANLSGLSHGPTPPIHSQLPTPPASTITNQTSSINGSSAQPSPISTTGQSFSNTSKISNLGDSNQASGVSQANSQYISFDNFMGLPQTDFLPFQTSMPLDQQYNGIGATVGIDSLDTNTLTSWPYTNPNIGAVDLDQDWNWVGNNPFAADWNSGMGNGISGAMNGIP